jgi:hypothetical protein
MYPHHDFSWELSDRSFPKTKHQQTHTKPGFTLFVSEGGRDHPHNQSYYHWRTIGGGETGALGGKDGVDHATSRRHTSILFVSLDIHIHQVHYLHGFKMQERWAVQKGNDKKSQYFELNGSFVLREIHVNLMESSAEKAERLLDFAFTYRPKSAESEANLSGIPCARCLASPEWSRRAPQGVQCS